jgi:hypothetical protein
MVQIATRDKEEDLPPVGVNSLEVSCQRPGSLRIQLRFNSQNSSLETMFERVIIYLNHLALFLVIIILFWAVIYHLQSTILTQHPN